MSAHAGPQIETDSLTSFVSFENKNTIEDINLSRNHALSKWYCHESSSNMRYTIVGKGGSLYEEDMSGNISLVDGPTTSEITSGSTTFTGGRYYYGDCPVLFHEQGQQFSISLGDWSDSNKIRTFEGQISGFKMYRKILTSAKVKRQYRAFRKRYK